MIQMKKDSNRKLKSFKKEYSSYKDYLKENPIKKNSDIVKLDSHIHSEYSHDANSKLEDIIDYSIEIGLDAITISDHNTMDAYERAFDLAKGKDILLIPSIELSSTGGHIIGFGLNEEIKMGLSPEETIDLIHSQDALAIIPHPFFKYRHGLFNDDTNYLDLDFDAIEVKNSRYLFGVYNRKAKKFAKKNKIPQIGASDSHFLRSIATCYTEVKIGSKKELNHYSILKAIKKGKTVAKGSRTSMKLIGSEFINKKIKKIY